MRSMLPLLALGAVLAFASSADANLLLNGNLDETYQQEIVPGFFLPKPTVWVNEGFRVITGPYEDELSSEPWAGPAPTPVTTNDQGVFFKAFSGNETNGAATGHLYQDVPAVPGDVYTLTGWAGGEPNFFGGAEFAIEFLDGTRGVIGGTTLDLLEAGLLDDNGLAFDYKLYELSATAPAGTVMVRARASMINGVPNPAGGGQAYVVDDFTLTPEPASLAALALLLVLRRR